MKRKRAGWKPRKPYLLVQACSARLILRPYSLKDYKAWHEAYASRLPKQHAFDAVKPSRSRLTREAFLRMLKRHRSWGSKGHLFVFGIFDRKTGAHLGAIDLYLLNREMRWANLGYQIHNSHWGKGYGPEAARLALKLAFGPLKLHRIEAGCEPGNRASIKTARRAGLFPEGLRRKFFPEKGGIDLLVFGMNAIDFSASSRSAGGRPSGKACSWRNP